MGCWRKLELHDWEKQKIGHQRFQKRTGTPFRPGRPIVIDTPKKIRLECKKCHKIRVFKVTSDDDKLRYSYSVKEKKYKFDNYSSEQKAAWLEGQIKKLRD